jgi:hypothetical protein
MRQRIYCLLRDIDLYVRSDGEQGGDRLMPAAAWCFAVWILFGVGVQLWLWFSRAHG